jgi:hypothetical protein
MRYSQPYHSAVALQRLITEAAPNAEDKDLAALTKSFVALEMLKLRLRMKPAPKPVDTTKLPQTKAKARAAQPPTNFAE